TPGLLLLAGLSIAAAVRERRTGASLEDELGVLGAGGVTLCGLFACLAVAGGGPRAGAWWGEGGGARGAGGVTLCGLSACLAVAELGREPWPLFAGLAVALGLLLPTMVRRAWAWIAPVALVTAGPFFTLWEEGYFHRGA